MRRAKDPGFCGFESRQRYYTGVTEWNTYPPQKRGFEGSSPSISAFRRSGRIGKCTCLLSRGRLVRHPGSGPGSGAQKNCRPYLIYDLQLFNLRLRERPPCHLVPDVSGSPLPSSGISKRNNAPNFL